MEWAARTRLPPPASPWPPRQRSRPALRLPCPNWARQGGTASTSSTPPPRRRRRRVRRRPVVVFEDILLVVCTAGRNAYGRIIRRRRAALRRRTRDVGVVTRPRQSGSRQRGFGGREEDHRVVSFKASLSKRAFLLKHERFRLSFFFSLFSFFCLGFLGFK